MGRLLIGIILASVAMFAFGFAYWGPLNPLPYSAWKQTPNDAAAQSALRSHFPEEGTYFVPTVHQDQETLTERYHACLIAIVHLVSTEGKDPFDPAIMIKGFVLNLVVDITYHRPPR